MHQLLFRGHQPEDVEGRQGDRHCQRPCCCRAEQEPCHRIFLSKLSYLKKKLYKSISNAAMEAYIISL